MKIKNLLLVLSLMIMSFSSNAIFLEALKRDNALEAQCDHLDKGDSEAKVKQCNIYYSNLTKTSAARIQACGDDKACKDSETALNISIVQASNTMSAQVAQQAVDVANGAATCKAQIEAFKKQITPSPNLTKDLESTSGTMKKCVSFSKGYMRSLYKGSLATTDHPTWDQFIKFSDTCTAKMEKECSATKSIETISMECMQDNELKTLASNCDAAAYLISVSGKNWENEEDISTELVKSNGNPQIICKSNGIPTLDYADCVKFARNGDIMDAAQGAIQTGQELYYKDKTMTAQMEASQSTNSATAALEAMKTGVKSQQDIMTQRAALDTGKLATLASYYSNIPSMETLKSLCDQYKAPAPLLSTCSASLYGGQSSFGLLLNQQAREKMKAKLAQLGVNVAGDAMMAALAAKQAGKISDAIAKVEAFKPIDPLAPAADNLQTTYCQQNPGDAKCLTGGLERTFDAMGDNVITFGEGGTGAAYNNSNPYLDPTAGTTNNAVAPGAKSTIASVGNVISAAQQSSGIADKVDAATVSKGAAPAGGGGGGGSGGGGSAGGGGGGVPGAQPQGGVTAAIGGKAPNYNGGSLSVFGSGGGGLNRSKSVAKTDGNPFGSLFNKDGNKNGALNFRDPASAKSVGTKGDNLFDMISKRYTTVNGDKRLLEYELAK